MTNSRLHPQTGGFVNIRTRAFALQFLHKNLFTNDIRYKQDSKQDRGFYGVSDKDRTPFKVSCPSPVTTISTQ